nr:uncharacterized protein LOC129276505 [Lytechinus pictus]
MKMASKKRENHKPPLGMRDSGVSCYTPSPPPKKSSLPRASEGCTRSIHKELCHHHPSLESFDEIKSHSSPEQSQREVVLPPRLDLNSIIGDDSESDVSSSGVASTDRTSQSHDEHYPELGFDTPSTEAQMSPADRLHPDYHSDSASPSPAPSRSSSQSSTGYHKLRGSGSGELEDESEGSVLKVKLKLKSTRPLSGSGGRKSKFTVTKVRTPPSSSNELLHGGKDQGHKDTKDDVLGSRYVPLPGIGVQGADQNANKSRGETEQRHSEIKEHVGRSAARDEMDIREQRLKALERSASQSEICRKFPTPPPHSAKTISRRAMRMQQFARRKSASHAESASKQGLRTSSKESDSSESILLAIRLPNGSRVQNLFDHTKSLQSVVDFALKQGKYSQGRSSICLITNELPKRELTDLSQTIAGAKLSDRTLLNLDVVD